MAHAIRQGLVLQTQGLRKHFGGVQSFFGPLAGAFGFKILEWLISRQWPVYWPLVLGGIVVVVIVVLPSGFVGLVGGRRWRRQPAVKA